MLRSGLRDYSDAYIVATGEITVVNESCNDTYNRKLDFENNAIFTACILKINRILVHNTKALDVLQHLCTILLNTARIMKKQQKNCDIIIEMNQKMVSKVMEMRK